MKNKLNKLRNCFRILLHSFEKKIVSQNLYFDGSYGLHNLNVGQIIYKSYAQMSSGGWQFLPTLKGRVSLPYDL